MVELLLVMGLFRQCIGGEHAVNVTEKKSNIAAKSHVLESEQKLNKMVHKLRTERKQRAYNFFDYKILFDDVKIEYDKYGYPTEQVLKKLIIDTYFVSEHTGLPKLDIEQQLKVFKLSQQQHGFYTEIMYAVELNNKRIFILKISSDTHEIERLIRVQTSDIGRYNIQSRYAQINLPVRKKDLPIICWLERIFVYESLRQSKKYIQVLHAAQGFEVSEILQYCGVDLKLDCLYMVGKALGSFQQLFMSYSSAIWTTVCHGDFHQGNIFFDFNNWRVYFIDNGTMQFNCPFNTDFNTLANSLVPYDMQYSDYPYHYLYFCQGYLDSFPSDKHKYLIQQIKKEVGAIFRLPLFSKACIDNINVFFNQYLLS